MVNCTNVQDTERAPQEGVAKGQLHALYQWIDDLPRIWVISAMTIVAWVVIVSRRADAVFRPQFFAEGGRVFYENAWNYGLHVLFRAHGGYLQMLPRIVAAIAVHLPVAWGPSAFVAVSAAIQIAPIWYWLSRRFDSVVPNWGVRIGFCLVYLVPINPPGWSMTLDIHGKVAKRGITRSVARQ